MPRSHSDMAISDTGVAIETLLEAISEEYRFVIDDPREYFHFHTGRPLARKLDYAKDWLANVLLEAPGNEAIGHRSPSYELASRSR